MSPGLAAWALGAPLAPLAEQAPAAAGAPAPALTGALLAAAAHLLALRARDLGALAAWLLAGQLGLLLTAAYLPAVAAPERAGRAALGLGLVALLAALGLLALVLALRRELGDAALERLRGLGWRSGWLAAALLVYLLALAGLPPTLGFWARAELALALLAAGHQATAALVLGDALLVALLALRLLEPLLLVAPEEPDEREPLVTTPALTRLAALPAAALLALGALPP